MYRPNTAFINVSRKQHDLRSMQQSSARREQLLAHVPQQQRAGSLQTQPKKGRGACHNLSAPALAIGPQVSF
jgi:hypothetical protein